MNTPRRSKRLGESSNKESETTPPKNAKKSEPKTPSKTTLNSPSKKKPILAPETLFDLLPSRSTNPALVIQQAPPRSHPIKVAETLFDLVPSRSNDATRELIKTRSKSSKKTPQKQGVLVEVRQKPCRQLDLDYNQESPGAAKENKRPHPNENLVLKASTQPDDEDVEMEECSRDQFKDETNAIMNVNYERYFNRNRTPGMNRARRTRKMGTKIEDTDDDQQEDKKELARNELLEMTELRNFMQKCDLSDDTLPKAIAKENEKLAKEHFPKWRNLLPLGFNLLVYGLGSKIRVLNDFQKQFFAEFASYTVDGFLQDVSIKGVLSALDEDLKLECPPKRGAKELNEWAAQIGKAIEKRGNHFTLIIHNIDGLNLRHPTEIEALASLASNSPKCIHIIASVDHINAQAIFNMRTLTDLRFVFCHFPTFRLPTKEILASESSILGFNSKSSKIQHTLSSLDVLWSSFPENSRKIFRLFFALYFLSNKAISFWDLFEDARDRFYVSTDVALRQQIVEFEDHRIVRVRRSEDGTEKLSSAVERDLIEKFLQEKGYTLEIDDDE
ncbi:unnamed protein product, partial [Mesorhabditis belari]|uniref:Origin recognition complex subunit 2 n=1 Tax=Mesorhabditis belari TaxID=2138241 RepID=A0AAF3J7S7_9BILA